MLNAHARVDQTARLPVMDTNNTARITRRAGSLELVLCYDGREPDEDGGFRRRYAYRTGTSDSVGKSTHEARDVYSGVGDPLDATGETRSSGGNRGLQNLREHWRWAGALSAPHLLRWPQREMAISGPQRALTETCEVRVLASSAGAGVGWARPIGKAIEGAAVDRKEAGFLAAEFDRVLELWCLVGGGEHLPAPRYVAGLLRERGVWPELVQRWMAADEQGAGAAACRVAWMLLDEGDQVGAEQALARAVRRDDFGALSWEMRRRREGGRSVARLERRSRRIERRRLHADERADSRGDADSAYRIGERLIREWQVFDTERYRIHERFRLNIATSSEIMEWVSKPLKEFRRVDRLFQEGEAALRRAAERGSADAAAHLGDLADRDDDFRTDRERAETALPWFRRADELGHASGAWRLGMVLSTLGDRNRAEAAFRRADARGNRNAPLSLAQHLEFRASPDWDGAEALYRRAAGIGYNYRAWSELADFLKRRGDLRGAESAYHKAVDRKEPQAKEGLRYFYRKHPDLKPLDTAELTFRQAESVPAPDSLGGAGPTEAAGGPTTPP